MQFTQKKFDNYAQILNLNDSFDILWALFDHMSIMFQNLNSKDSKLILDACKTYLIRREAREKLVNLIVTKSSKSKHNDDAFAIRYSYGIQIQRPELLFKLSGGGA